MLEHSGPANKKQIQEELLCFLPQWNCHVFKPFKQTLDEGVSMEMYFCIQMLRWVGGTATMSELGQATQISKQHMTKMVNRLVEHGFVERISDPTDRRIIKIQLTDEAMTYIDHFLDEDAKCFQSLLDQMSQEDLLAFQSAIQTLAAIFDRLPYKEKDG